MAIKYSIEYLVGKGLNYSMYLVSKGLMLTSLQQIEVCNQEAVKLATLINNRAPLLTSDPYLSHLIAARAQVSYFRSTLQVNNQGGVADINSAYQSGQISLSVFVCITLLFFFFGF